MLKKLKIEQFVIIDKLDLDLQSGLTILTGETGAGKSILLDAFLLALGAPPDFDAIRQGAERSIIEGHFGPLPNNLAFKLLADNGFESDPAKGIVVHRELTTDRIDLIEVNGKEMELDLLKKMGELLGEIHGQNANHTLLDPLNQMNVLDISGTFTPGAFENVSNALKKVENLIRLQQEETEFLNNNSRFVNKLDQLVKKLEDAGAHITDIPQTRADYARLLTAKESSEAIQEITSHLISSNGAIRILSAANMALTRQKNLDPEKIKTLAELLHNASENARSAVIEANRLAPEYEIDIKPLNDCKQRLDALAAMSAETKVPVDELPEYHRQVTAKVSRIRNGQKTIADLGDQIVKAKNEFRVVAHVLTEQRIVAGEELSKKVNAELPKLRLPKAEFSVLVEEKPDDPWTHRGFNLITFTARMNPGMPFSPIAETASGGEMARLVLAIKVVLQTIQLIPTLVFDEVDVGIGGAAAAALGERIAHLADTTQVITITHSPQVAARGDQHLYVSKKIENSVTTSAVRTLTLDERIGEISRMLAGEQITGEAQAAAAKLIEEAKASGAARRAALKAPPQQAAS